MARSISICIVGAGSSYTPELIEGLLAQAPEQLPISRIYLTDINHNRLAIMTGLSERMVREKRRDITIKSNTRLEKMLEDVDFIITQIRVGGMGARYLDESIPLKYGIIGQETTGPGGMFKALRTIPAMLDIAHKVEQVAPKAIILNYTNPTGIIAEAVYKYSKARCIALCSSIPGIQRRLKSRLEHIYPDLKTYCVGINHLCFIHRMISKKKDVTRKAIDLFYTKDKNSPVDNASAANTKLAKLISAVPVGYASYYFRRRQRLEEARSAKETRAQTIQKIEKEIFAEAALSSTNRKPKALEQRGGGGYSSATFSVMSAIWNDTDDELPANVPNQGSIEGIADDGVVEVICRVNKKGAKPLPVGPIPLAFRGLVQAVKTYETLAVEAAVQRSRHLAMQALVAHPLVGDMDVSKPLLTEMLNAHGLKFT